MEVFYEFINLLNELDFNYFEDKQIFKVEFKFNDKFNFFIKYNTLNQMKCIFGSSIRLYKGSSINNEKDLFLFLDSKEEFNDEIEDLEENINFKLIIDKTSFIKEKIGDLNCNIIFFIKCITFLNLINKDFREMEKLLFTENEKNVFILGDCDEFFFNEFYLVTNIERKNFKDEINEFIDKKCSLNTAEIIRKRNELCNWVDGTHFLSPELLYVNFDNNNFIYSYEFKQIIVKKSMDLIIPFIANFTGKVDGIFTSIINGKKRIEIEYKVNKKIYKLKSYKELYELYRWIYEQAIFDKINICRNVISILVSAKYNSKCPKCMYQIVLENIEWMVKSVKDNFNDYLKNNIDEYFKQKQTLIKDIKANINSINEVIESLTKLITSNFLSLIGTVVAGIIALLIKGDYSLATLLILIYRWYININFIYVIPNLLVKLFRINTDYTDMRNIYNNNYISDSFIEKNDKRRIWNNIIFGIYFLVTIVIIVAVNLVLKKFYADDQTVNSFIKFLKTKV
ncbi:hypothetical protein [Clostridium sp. CTA-1]